MAKYRIVFEKHENLPGPNHPYYILLETGSRSEALQAVWDFKHDPKYMACFPFLEVMHSDAAQKPVWVVI